jgi:hypothetical protein
MAKDGTRRGRPKGSKSKKTLEKEAARVVLRELVLAEMQPMVEAQVKHAKGISYLVYREKKGGKFTKVTADNAQEVFKLADKKGDEGGVIIEVWEKEPHTPAFTDLMNRAIDKPADQLTAQLEHSGTLVIQWQK